MRFDTDQLHTVVHALQIAARTFREDQSNMEKVAVAIRAGQAVPMFAEGENGAVAADRLAGQFYRQATDCEDLLDVIEEDDED